MGLVSSGEGLGRSQPEVPKEEGTLPPTCQPAQSVSQPLPISLSVSVPLALSFLYTRTRTRTHSLSLLGLSLWRTLTDEPTSHPTSPTTLGSRSNSESESAEGLPGRERRSRVTGTEDQGGAGAGPGAEAGDMPSRRKPQRGALSVQVQNGPQNQTGHSQKDRTTQHKLRAGNFFIWQRTYK